MNQIVYFLNSIAANGADCSISNGLINFKGIQIPLTGIYPTAARQAYVAETLQLNTGVVTSAHNTYFSYNIVANSEVDQAQRLFNVAPFLSSAAASRSEIAGIIVDAVNQMASLPVVAALTGSPPNEDFTLTAVTPNAKFTSESGDTPGIITTTVTTPGVAGIGGGAILALQYPTLVGSYGTTLVTTNNYSTYAFRFLDQASIFDGTHQSGDYSAMLLYINEADSDFASLCGTYGTLTQALQGVTATWATAGGNASVSNGVITLGGSDVFYGNTDTNIGLQAGDVVVIGGVNYPIASILTGTTAATYGVPNDASGAATSYVKLRSSN